MFGPGNVPPSSSWVPSLSTRPSWSAFSQLFPQSVCWPASFCHVVCLQDPVCADNVARDACKCSEGDAFKLYNRFDDTVSHDSRALNRARFIPCGPRSSQLARPEPCWFKSPLPTSVSWFRLLRLGTFGSLLLWLRGGRKGVVSLESC